MSLQDDPRFQRFRTDREPMLAKVLFLAILPIELLVLLLSAGYIQRSGPNPAGGYSAAILHLGVPFVVAVWLWARSLRIAGSWRAGGIVALVLFVLVIREGFRLLPASIADAPDGIGLVLQAELAPGGDAR